VRAETRHQLKQDRFNRVTMGAAEATAHWTVEHRNTLMVAAVVVLVAVLAITGGWYYMNQRNDEASLGISQAVRTLETPTRPAGMPAQPEYFTFASDKERQTTAHKQFQAVVDNYPHTHSAEFGLYFLGVTDASMGNNAAAEREFKDAAALRNRDVGALAEFALASLYRNTNRTKDAIDLYKKLIDKPASTVAKSTAQMALAETYQEAGQSAEAKRLLEQIQKENPATDAAQMASQKLQDLR